MRPKWPKLIVWPRKYAHSGFSSLMHSLGPKDTPLRTYFSIFCIYVFISVIAEFNPICRYVC